MTFLRVLPSKLTASLTVAVTLCAACATGATAQRSALRPNNAPPPPQGVSLSPSPDVLDARTMAAALEGHGRWTETPRFGPVWIPDAASGPSFTPYLQGGRWVATEGAWFWRADEAWGAVTHHYGRWTSVEGAWAWVPGSTFAPAWVEWRSGGGWIGWSPRAPDGDEARSPFVYTAADALAGDGLASRAVQGAAAVSLFALTPDLSAPASRGGRTLAEVWRSALPGPLDGRLSVDGEVAARLQLQGVPSVRAEAETLTRSRLIGRSYDVARAVIAPLPRSSRPANGYAPVHMPPPVEAWPVAGSFRFGAPLRGVSSGVGATRGAATPEFTAITPTFSGTPSAAPSQTFETTSVGGGVGLSAPPAVTSTPVADSPTAAP
jgi:hypothetical protein